MIFLEDKKIRVNTPRFKGAIHVGSWILFLNVPMLYEMMDCQRFWPMIILIAIG